MWGIFSSKCGTSNVMFREKITKPYLSIISSPFHSKKTTSIKILSHHTLQNENVELFANLGFEK